MTTRILRLRQVGLIAATLAALDLALLRHPIVPPNLAGCVGILLNVDLAAPALAAVALAFLVSPLLLPLRVEGWSVAAAVGSILLATASVAFLEQVY